MREKNRKARKGSPLKRGLSNKPPPDEPSVRHQATMMDIVQGSEGRKLSDLRLAPLQHSQRILSSKNTSSSVNTTSPYQNFSIPPIPGSSNWIQVGPTCIIGGGTISSYYYWSGLLSSDETKTALVTGRVTAVVVDYTDSNVLYVGTAQGGIWKTTDCGRNWAPKSDYSN